MDIDQYVKQYLPDQGGEQFAAIAFDMSVVGGKAHPPPLQDAQFGYDPTYNSPSGPWSAPVVALTSKTMVDYEYTDATKFHNHSLKIHPDQVLMKFLYPHYILRYYSRYNQLPRSVSFYTYFSPCEECLQSIRNYPSYAYQVEFGKSESIGIWTLFFDHLYAENDGDSSQDKVAQFISDQRNKADNKNLKYVNQVQALQRVFSLRRDGWNVINRCFINRNTIQSQDVLNNMNTYCSDGLTG